MIYAVQSRAGGPIKFGLTAVDVRKRLSQLQNGNPEPLSLLATTDGDSAMERLVHEHLAPYRKRGEWFKPLVPVLEMVRLMREGRALQGIALKITEDYRAAKAQ